MIYFREKNFTLEVKDSNFESFHKEIQDTLQRKNKSYLLELIDESRGIIREKCFNLYENNANISDLYSDKDKFWEYVQEEIYEKQNLGWIIYFTSDEKKQGFDQRCQVDFITSKFGSIVDKIELLSSSGKSCWHCVNGSIVKGVNSSTKSIDCKITYRFKDKELLFYGTLKYIRSAKTPQFSKTTQLWSRIETGGGGQDNQHKDVKLTNEEFLKLSDENIRTFSQLDGGFYSMGSGKKFKELSSKYNTETNRILHSDDIGDYLIEMIISWLEKNFNSEDMDVRKEINRLQTKRSIK